MAEPARDGRQLATEFPVLRRNLGAECDPRFSPAAAAQRERALWRLLCPRPIGDPAPFCRRARLRPTWRASKGGGESVRAAALITMNAHALLFAICCALSLTGTGATWAVPDSYIVELWPSGAGRSLWEGGSVAEVAADITAQYSKTPGSGAVTNVYDTQDEYGTTIGFASNGLGDPAAIAADPRVQSVSPNFIYSSGGGDGAGGHLRGSRSLAAPFDAEFTPPGVAWVLNGRADTLGSTDCTLIENTAWIVDTGIQPYHPDLQVDAALSVNFVADPITQTVEPGAWDDLNHHGTHVAGTVAAIGGNGVGVVGVCPGAPLAAIRVLDASGSGQGNSITAGLEHVAQNVKKGDVVNFSIWNKGAFAANTALLPDVPEPADINNVLKQHIARINSKGAYFVAIAGNAASRAHWNDWARPGGETQIPDAPDNIYTVAAVSIDPTTATLAGPASFSNWDDTALFPLTEVIEFALPGVNIWSTVPESTYDGTFSGTSMAAPHLSGLILRCSSAGLDFLDFIDTRAPKYQPVGGTHTYGVLGQVIPPPPPA
ncbi:peptidase S8/S53 domain-containing protein [Tribonema minus]|uniref:subtilisin n=1 Tax=Tribonema minus TaxID=303371 RepID=A0A836CEJ1_9STRA|nr:peptidase S8/S53 domain-containing protein [Tribonema minus]